MKRKNWLAICLSCALVLGMFVFAAPVNAAANMTDSVTGVTLKDKDNNGLYELSNANELKAFANLVNSGNTDIGGELTADIDLNGSASNPWTPIGKEYSVGFTGAFDGQGHKVRNLYVDRPDDDYAGLFGTITDAKILHVTVSGGSVKGKDAGGIVGNITMNSDIIGCGNEGVSVFGSSRAGGIAGTLSRAGTTIMACWNTGEVSVLKSSAGGIVGGAFSNSNKSWILSCWNGGTISGEAEAYVGGIAGYLRNTYIRYCYSQGRLNCSNDYTGALAAYGEAVNTSDTWIKYCIMTSSTGTDEVGKDMVYDEFYEVSYLRYNILSTGGAAWFMNQRLSDSDYAYSQDLSKADSRPVVMKKSDPAFKTVYKGYASCAREVSYVNDPSTVRDAVWHKDAYLGYTSDESTNAIHYLCLADKGGCGTVLESVYLKTPTDAVYTPGESHNAISVDSASGGTEKDKINGQDIVITYKKGGAAATDTVDAGDYTAYMQLEIGGVQYTVSDSFTVARADVSANMVTCVLPSDIFYDGAPHTAKVNADPTLQGLGEITVHYYKNGVEVEQPIHAGTYDVKVQFKQGNNYKASTSHFDMGSFDIAPKELTVTPDAGQYKSYGDSDPESFAFAVSGLVDGAVPTGSLSRESGETVGSYGYNLGTLSYGDDYTLSLAGSEVFSVKKADPVIGEVTATIPANETSASAVTLVRSDETVAGTLTLDDLAAVYVLGDNTATWTFVPDDTDNYNVLTGEVVVTVTDTIAPEAGLPSGSSFYVTTEVTFTDANALTITVNGEAAEGNTVTLPGNTQAVYTVVVTDAAGNSAEFVYEAMPIEELLGDTDEISESTVKTSDKTALEEVKGALEAQLSEGGTMTEDEQQLLQQLLTQTQNKLDVIGDAYDAVDTEAVGTLAGLTPEEVEIHDKAAVEQAKKDLEEALKAYGDNYTDQEKAILQEAIDLADACLEKIKALEKELATPDSGDSSEINTLLAVSAVCAVTALTLGAPILKKRQREN